jgi:dephospho-CoA kinase
MKAFKYATALTGSIATGKSSVLKIFIKWGFSFIDADRTAHMVLQREKREIAKIFGLEYIVDNRVDRKALGELIFANSKEKKKLENLLHPLIYREIESQSRILDSLKKPYLIDIPLFFETNHYPIEKSIVVYTPREIQLNRLMQRDDLSKKEALQRIDSQLDIEIKKDRASYLINNSEDLNSLQEECAKVKQKILSDFR